PDLAAADQVVLRQARRPALGRAAADGLDRPHAAVAAPLPDVGRALDRSCAEAVSGSAAADPRAAAGSQHGGDPGRAECARGAEDLRPRGRDEGGAGDPRYRAGGIVRQRAPHGAVLRCDRATAERRQRAPFKADRRRSKLVTGAQERTRTSPALTASTVNEY